MINIFTDEIEGIGIYQNCNKERKLRFKCLYLNNLIFGYKEDPILIADVIEQMSTIN